MESVSDYMDPVKDGEMEEQTAFLQNGFNPEEDNCDNCAEKLKEKPQATADESTSCPITPKRAALLYPLKVSLVLSLSQECNQYQAKTKG